MIAVNIAEAVVIFPALVAPILPGDDHRPGD
jgi:hypothetical protein